jgi:two-component system, OmpR family, sensor kinase
MNPLGSGLASRLSRVLSVWVGGIWIVGSMAVAWFVNTAITSGFDATLAISAHRLIDLVVLDSKEGKDGVGSGSPRIVSKSTSVAKGEAHLPSTTDVKPIGGVIVPVSQLVYQAFDAAGRLTIRSEGAPEKALLADFKPGYADVPPWRTYVTHNTEKSIYIVTADTLANRADLQRETLLWLLLPLLLLLPLMGLAVYKLTRRELLAFEQLAEEIAARGGGNLTPISISGASSEMNTIAVGTNQLLSRLDDALHTERSLAANAAHELRTPLASARLSLSTAQSFPMVNEAKDALQQLAGSLDTLSKRAEKLLQLSRAEAAATLSHDEVDLAVLASMVTQEFWNNPSVQSRLKLALPENAVVMVQGNFDTLAIALRNLIENALKYAPEGNIFVSVSSPASITVRDEGAGVAEKDLSKLRHRRVRLSMNQTGYGLGMSIVRTIAEKSGGHLVLRSPPVGYPHGFEAVLKFEPQVA